MEFQITTQDNETLHVKQYKAVGNKTVIVAPAVGISQGYYKHIANFLSEAGYDVITFDYRGISKSSKVSNPENCTILNWGKQDLEAVISHVSKHYSNDIYLIGHSIAGQVFPFAESNYKVKAAYFVASQNLSITNWSGGSKLLVNIFWDLIIPTFTIFKNPLPAFAYGGTQSLPYGVAANWRRWGKHKDGANGSEPDGYKKYSNIGTPTKFVGFTDDLMFAPVAAVKKLHEVYGVTKKECQIIDPSKTDLKEVGHFNFFKKEKKSLWIDVINWFESV